MAHVVVCVKMVEILVLVKIEGSFLLVRDFIENPKDVDLIVLVDHFVSLLVIHDLQVVEIGIDLRYVVYLLRFILERVVV